MNCNTTRALCAYTSVAMSHCIHSLPALDYKLKKPQLGKSILCPVFIIQAIPHMHLWTEADRCALGNSLHLFQITLTARLYIKS